MCGIGKSGVATFYRRTERLPSDTIKHPAGQITTGSPLPLQSYRAQCHGLKTKPFTGSAKPITVHN
jgi:hypothetical protein